MILLCTYILVQVTVEYLEQYDTISIKFQYKTGKFVPVVFEWNHLNDTKRKHLATTKLPRIPYTL